MRALVKQDQRKAGRIALAVVTWFKENARDLPWRRTKDAYPIWISEVMLQQTQVKTVIPYWERWMQLFPGVQALASAPLQNVLKAWEGLGYYTRARNLQKAASIVCAEHQGRFPRAFDDVLALPGIGRYTAGAICSIAYGDAVPILDGNVARVIARLFAIATPTSDSATREVLWQWSEALVKRAGDCSALNQGLMELGATVCLPRDPLCAECPLKNGCEAYRLKSVHQFPVPKRRSIMRERQFVAFLLEQRDRVLVRQRPANLVNGGLWEFPNIEIQRDEDLTTTLHSLGIELKPVSTIKHTITRNRITLRAFAGEANGRHKVLAQHFAAEWRPIKDLNDFPFSSAHAKLRALVRRPKSEGADGRFTAA